MAPLRIDPDTYSAASRIFGASIADSIFTAYTTLQGALDGCTAMAGSDPAGVEWGAAYDAAAVTISGVTQDVINGCYQLAGLLEQSGFNHGRANAASTPGGAAQTADTTQWEGFSVFLGGFATASGSSAADTPSGWWLVEHTVGYVWPNGDTGRLRTAAAAWARAAQSLTTTASMVDEAVTVISGQQSPEVADATTASTAMKTHLSTLSASLDDMSRACTTYADHIDRAHAEAIAELQSLIAWTVAIEAAGLAGAVFTLGGSEAAAQAAVAARIAKTALAIATIIAHLIELTHAVVSTITTAKANSVSVSQQLTPLLGAALSTATASQVAQLNDPNAPRTDEQDAIDGLQFATPPDTAFFWSGNTDGIGGDQVAGQYAAAAGGTTLEQLMLDRGIALPPWDRNDPAAVQAWKDASEAYAEGASGTVRAVIGTETRPGSVWETVELPALKANPYVTEIIVIDPKSGAETVVHNR